MLKAKHDGKVNREEVPESREEPSPRAKTWLWDSGKKGGTGSVGGLHWVGENSLEMGWGDEMSGISACPSVSALLPYALLSNGVRHHAMGDEF